ncbi:kairos [Leptinotarsa decemlineata]|uniref:kairos n=1 Tax=Leptinotarsa decemlineata TaxID=7539 RepID=UPI003D30697E
MRRSSILRTQTSEPLIVVEDEEHEEEKNESSSRQSSEDESTSMNPYLLSPYAREIRKHSLPTPQCSGITASQVRRLSERAETAGPGPRQAEFLATLSSAPQASPSGRRHSVVTISRVPPAFFGRNRRESVAAFASSAFPNRILPNRRESIACPPSTEPRGSVHNLQLDIMDDIVQARKVRMKMWNTSSEKVCEVQPLDETGSVQRYTNSGRRFSDFVGTTLAPIPSMSKRRASELPPPTPSTSSGTSKKQSTGIVCSNTDLISILSSLSTSATEINRCQEDQPLEKGMKNNVPRKRGQLKNARSNSFDISILHETDNPHQSPSWFVKRHQPIAKTEEYKEKKPALFTNIKEAKKVVEKEPGKVVWDERSGSIVDPQALGSAIEVFLRKSSPEAASSQTSNVAPMKNEKSTAGRSKNWFSKGDEESTETCESSICSTLKDLFVK